MITNNKQKFPLGKIVATPGALETLSSSGETPASFLNRHLGGDWGDICDEDKRLNDEAVECGFRILSAFKTQKDVTLWIITEADRSSTCILLPEEY